VIAMPRKRRAASPSTCSKTQSGAPAMSPLRLGEHTADFRNDIEQAS